MIQKKNHMKQSRTSSEIIKQRRSQMLIHSYLYYQRDISIVSDDQWQEWANELQCLQENNKDPIGFYDEVFKDWDGSTGMHLPTDVWIRRKAEQLLTHLGK